MSANQTATSNRHIQRLNPIGDEGLEHVRMCHERTLKPNNGGMALDRHLITLYIGRALREILPNGPRQSIMKDHFKRMNGNATLRADVEHFSDEDGKIVFSGYIYPLDDDRNFHNELCFPYRVEIAAGKHTIEFLDQV